MARKSLALLLLALTLPAAHAQEAAPATPAAPTAPAATAVPSATPSPDIKVDPLAVVDSMPRQGTLLTGLYATRATIELCEVPLGEPSATAMNAHQRQLETELRLDETAAGKAYDAVKADVEKAGVDCAENSADRKQAEAVISIYAGNP